MKNDHYVLSVIRAVLHYGINNLFIDSNQVLLHMNRISHLPAIIIHGAMDINCPVEQAILLHENWENSNLIIVENVDHSSKEAAMVSAVVAATKNFQEILLCDIG